MKYIKLVCVATETNSFLDNWKESARTWGYDFDVIGIGQEWKGFQTKLDLVCDYLTDVDRECIVAIADSYDLLLSGPPSEMLDKYMNLSDDGACLFNFYTFYKRTTPPSNGWAAMSASS